MDIQERVCNRVSFVIYVVGYHVMMSVRSVQLSTADLKSKGYCCEMLCKL